VGRKQFPVLALGLSAWALGGCRKEESLFAPLEKVECTMLDIGYFAEVGEAGAPLESVSDSILDV